MSEAKTSRSLNRYVQCKDGCSEIYTGCLLLCFQRLALLYMGPKGGAGLFVSDCLSVVFVKKTFVLGA